MQLHPGVLIQDLATLYPGFLACFKTFAIVGMNCYDVLTGDVKLLKHWLII